LSTHATAFGMHLKAPSVLGLTLFHPLQKRTKLSGHFCWWRVFLRQPFSKRLSKSSSYLRVQRGQRCDSWCSFAVLFPAMGLRSVLARHQPRYPTVTESHPSASHAALG
jgi:hypothetical protein